MLKLRDIRPLVHNGNEMHVTLNHLLFQLPPKIADQIGCSLDCFLDFLVNSQKPAPFQMESTKGGRAETLRKIRRQKSCDTFASRGRGVGGGDGAASAGEGTSGTPAAGGGGSDVSRTPAREEAAPDVPGESPAVPGSQLQAD
ncbi:putative Ubiquitin Carboxyl-Terminal Hydrolase Faf-X [Manis pentadactyla]|nr:putative Ubiquitin Carboxyl-Terminal Hydrolase Faf-X [Manis pentadactyla]